MKKLFALVLAGAMLFCTACSEAPPMETESKPDWWVDPTPTPNPSQAIKLGETFQTSGSATTGEWDENGPPERDLLEVTVHGYTVYDHYSDSGIPKEEFVCGSEFDIQQTPLVMVDVTIKKVSGVEEEVDRYSRENITDFSLYSKKQLQWCEENDQEAVMSEPDYFSGHGDWDADYKGYTYYWLDVGEEKDYQIGYFLNDPNGRWGGPDSLTTVEGGLMLKVNGRYIDLDN